MEWVFALKHSVLCCLLGNVAESHAFNNKVKRSPLNVSSVNCVLMKSDQISLGTFDPNKLLVQFTFSHSLFHGINIASPSLMTGDWMLLLVLITLHPCVKHASNCTTCSFCHCVSILFELCEPHLSFTMMCLQYFVYIFLCYRLFHLLLMT